ncbi:MAG: T9SS type A sorting domain-containing protein, partial [Flavobacteriales bacterium]
QEGGHANGAGQSELRGTKQEGLLLYPNPNAGNELFVNLTGIEASTETVNVDIYDAFGKRVAQRTIGVQDGYVNTTIALNGELANGMYMVSISSAAGVMHTERLVIQK